MVRKLESNKDLQKLKDVLKDPDYFEICGSIYNARWHIQVDGRSDKEIENDIIEFAKTVRNDAIKNLKKYSNRPKLSEKIMKVVSAADSVMWQVKEIAAIMMLTYNNVYEPYKSGMRQERLGIKEGDGGRYTKCPCPPDIKVKRSKIS